MSRPDCARHKKEIAGIDDMKALAEMIGDLHYETLSQLLFHLSNKLYKDGQKDLSNGRAKLSRSLFDAQMSVFISSQHVSKAWEISKPFMDNQNQTI